MSGDKIPDLIAMKIASICLRIGDAASREYSNALLSPGTTWYPASLRKDKLTFAFDIHERMVAFAEWVATFCKLVGERGRNSSLNHTLASDDVSGCSDHPPPDTGHGIVGCDMLAHSPALARCSNQALTQSRPVTPGTTPATGRSLTTWVLRFIAVLWWYKAASMNPRPS